MELEFGEIVSVPLNQIWQYEERHLTPLLAQNIEKLGEEWRFAVRS